MPATAPASSAAAGARQRRAEVWSTLLGICRSLERLQTTPEAKAACRQVGEELAALLTRDRGGARRRR